MELSTGLQNKIIDFLITLPNIHDNDSQRAFLYQVGLDSQLQTQILIGKPPAQFIPLFVFVLLKYGKLNDGRYALEAVLETAKNYIGYDRKAYCDILIKEAHEQLNNYVQPNDTKTIKKGEEVKNLTGIDYDEGVRTIANENRNASTVDNDPIFRVWNYELNFIKNKIKKSNLGEKISFKWNKTISEPQFEIHVFKKKDHTLPVILSLYEWIEKFVLPEWDSAFGQGEIDYCSAEYGTDEVTIGWHSTDIEKIWLLPENRIDEQLHYFESWLQAAEFAWAINPEITLLVYKLLRDRGVDELLDKISKCLDTTDRTNHPYQYQSVLFVAMMEWVIFSLEEHHKIEFLIMNKPEPDENGRIFSYNPMEFPLYSSPIRSPKKQDWFISFIYSLQAPLSEDQIDNILQSLESRPRSASIVKEIREWIDMST